MKIKILQMNTKNFWKKTAKLLKNVLNKLNEINSVLNKNKNIKNKNSQLINLSEEISKNNIKSNIDKISNVILKEFEDIIPLLKKEKPKKNNYFTKSTGDITSLFSKTKGNSNIDKKKNKSNEKQNNNQINKNNIKKKDIEINIIYSSQYEFYQNIFGDKFVKNNFKNIKLNINGKESSLVHEFKLKKGNNNIKMIIINKLTNLEYMFYECESLINIDELKFLDTSEVNNYSNMFNGIQSLINVKPLKNWKVSKSENFSFINVINYLI